MPSPHIGAEAITPVISATGRIQGNSAIPVYVYTSIPADRRGLGMAAQPVVFINDSDLVENGGQYKLQGRLTALPVIQMPAGSRSIGMPAIPVYDVTNKVWPPAFNPVVPTPPSSFPPITTGLQLDLQADVAPTTNLTPYAGTGTVIQDDNNVGPGPGTYLHGTGTKFTQEVYVGDLITGAGISGTVVSVDSDLLVHLDSSTLVIVGVPYTITPQAGSPRFATWSDASSLNHDFAQVTLGAQPIYNAAGKYAGFNLGAWLVGSDFADNLASATFFLVFRAAGTVPYILSKMNDSNSNAGWLVSSNITRAEFYIQDDQDNNQLATQQLAIDVTVFHVMTAELLGLNQNIVVYYNGDNSNQNYADNSGVVVAYGNNQPVRIGATGLIIAGGVDLQSVMIYSPALSPADRATMEQALKTKYGIP